MSIDDIRQLIAEERVDEAITAAGEVIGDAGASVHERAMAYYLRGNAYRKFNDLKQAMNSYLESMELEPDGPAAMAYSHAQEVMAFYCKDLYNP